jgi:hypothetical protein
VAPELTSATAAKTPTQKELSSAQPQPSRPRPSQTKSNARPLTSTTRTWLRLRVGASYRFLVYLGMPFGAMLGGFLANSLGLRSALAVNGIVLMTIGLAIPLLLRDHASAHDDDAEPALTSHSG